MENNTIKCRQCLKEKDKEAFIDLRKPRKNEEIRYTKTCDICRAILRKSREKTKSAHIRHRKNREATRKFKLSKGKCIDCGMADYKNKTFNISSKSHLKLDSIKDEFDKIVLRCARCHQKRSKNDN